MLAFYEALRRLARLVPPLVVDTPLGRLDKEVREAVLDKLYLSGHQSLILSTNSEIDPDGPLFQKIKKRLARVYTLHPHGKEDSDDYEVRVTSDYFGKVYDRLRTINPKARNNRESGTIISSPGGEDQGEGERSSEFPRIFPNREFRFHARPHPGPLLQERENRFPSHKKIERRNLGGHRRSNQRRRRIFPTQAEAMNYTYDYLSGLCRDFAKETNKQPAHEN